MQSFLDKKKALLEEKRNLILKSLAALPDDMHQRNQHVGDSIDKSKAQVDHAEASDLRLRENESLRRVEAALKRMEAGLYEECEECGDEIPRGRLDVNPTAIRCVECQEDHEKYNSLPKKKRTLLN